MFQKLLRRKELSPEERATLEAEREYEVRAKEAKRHLRDVQRAYDKAVKAAERAVEDAGKPQVISRLTFFGTILYDDRIKTPEGTCELSPAVTAMVDTAGNVTSRITATRLVTLGVFALAAKKKKDNRELYVVIDTPQFTSVQELKPDRGREARQFAAKVNTQAKIAGPIIEARNERIRVARANLDAVRANRTGIETAEAALMEITRSRGEEV